MGCNDQLCMYVALGVFYVKVQIHRKGIIFYSIVQLPAHANDIVIIVTSGKSSAVVTSKLLNGNTGKTTNSSLRLRTQLRQSQAIFYLGSAEDQKLSKQQMLLLSKQLIFPCFTVTHHCHQRLRVIKSSLKTHTFLTPSG